jgi:biotin-(acetyl-CoA carboxylase) ligase
VRALTKGQQQVWQHPKAVDHIDSTLIRRLKMAPRLALLSLVLAFGVSVAIAAVTTVRQVHLESASAVVHAAHS